MALVRWSPTLPATQWSPWREFESLRQDIDRLFNAFWNLAGREVLPVEAMWAPRVDYMERDDEFVIQADLPGMNLEDIDIQFHGDTLTIKGERKAAYEGDSGYQHRERYYGSFYRSFSFGVPVDAEHITATYKNGVLEVHVPKAAEAKPKRIAVQAS
ncbi:MAG: molecular chaperone [Candidatus Tectimicrobiota bacterium]|nr:MAG: molecular chaperone [Candidatus Tectomicrobia bacterium]